MENGKQKMEAVRKQTIRSYRDLRVYQQLYKTQITVLTVTVPKLPKEERYDLADQMRRACKAPCALIAEGFAKRYQKRNWQKYLDDAIGECNEMTNHLTVCHDAYAAFIEPTLCLQLIAEYDSAARQLFRLRQSWQNFHERM